MTTGPTSKEPIRHRTKWSDEYATDTLFQASGIGVSEWGSKGGKAPH